MLSIKLARHGKKHQPNFRIVVIDSRKPTSGAFLEIIGHYNPRTEPSAITLDHGRYTHWVKLGAQASETVKKLAKISAPAADAAPAGDAAAEPKPKKAKAAKAAKPAKKAEAQ